MRELDADRSLRHLLLRRTVVDPHTVALHICDGSERAESGDTTGLDGARR
ncbi:hypothetical protein [Rhodococcus sp. BS-15]|nr:hypothetical protein [Rhodococcus sp. BS-15]